MAEFFVCSTKWSAVAQWAASTAYSVGDLRRQLAAPTDGNQRVFRCTTAGTSGASEPAWNLNAGATTNDGSCVWTEVTANSAYGWNAAAWNLNLAASRCAVGDTIWLGNTHQESWTASHTVSLPTGASNNAGVNVICVDDTVAAPTIADRTTGAICETSGGTTQRDYTVNGIAYIYGVTFRCATGNINNKVRFAVGNVHDRIILDNCYIRTHHSLVLGGSSGVSTSSSTYCELINTKLEFTFAQDGVSPRGVVVWRDTDGMMVSATNKPPLLNPYYAGFAQIEYRNCDLSQYGSGNSLFGPGSWIGYPVENSMVSCKLGSNVSVYNYQNTGNSHGMRINSISSDTSGTIHRNERHSNQGYLLTDTTLYRASGANVDGTRFSWRMYPRAQNARQHPFEAFPIQKYNSTTGQSVTVTIYGISNHSAIPTNADVWADIEYNGSASSPANTLKSSGPATPLSSTSSLTADSSDWDGGLTARANSTSYTVGQLIRVASNPGRAFICITAGTSASSEPSGYSTAVDGSSVSDGTATFRAMWRWKIEVVLTSPNPAVAGYITARIRMGSTNTNMSHAVDPALVLT